MNTTKTAIVYYCWAINNWKERTADIFNRMQQSGLYDMADDLYFIVADTEHKIDELTAFIAQYPKFVMEYEAVNHGGEHRGIWKVEEIGRREEEYNILYTHSKGVYNKYTNVHTAQEVHQLKIDGINCWTEMLTYFTVERWKDCVAKLNEGYDTTGTRNVHRWWWGNFWWASSRHIKKLRAFTGGSRWECEAWLHESRSNEEQDPIKFYEHHKFSYNPYYTVLPRYLYDTTDKSDITFTIHKAEYGCFNEQTDEGQAPPKHPDVIDVTGKIKELSTECEIIYMDHKTLFHQLHTCDGRNSTTRIYFSTSREPDVTYVITTHPAFNDINYMYKNIH